MRYCLFLCFCWVNLALIAQTNPALDRLAATPALAHANWGVVLTDVASGEVLLAKDPDRSLPPASTLKVLTTAAALGTFGPEHRFRTELGYTGEIVDGVLRGDLYLKGYGDPTLASPKTDGVARLPDLLAQWLSAVRSAGITRVEGGVVADAGYFNAAPTPADWQWKDLGNYYGAGAYGLNFHDNQYTLYFQQSAPGTRPGITKTEPPVAGLQFRNEVISAGRGDNSYIYNGEGSLRATVRGTITPGSGLFDIDGALPDPPLYAAQCLHDALTGAGLTVTAAPRRGSAAGPVLHTVRSPALRDIVRATNLRSVNLYAETLLLHLGKRAGGADDRAAGLAALRAFWTGRGVDLAGAFLQDGSGLSGTNGLTARQLAAVLARAAQDPVIAGALHASLPVAGQSGGMRSLLRGDALAGNLRAKTGTLKRTRCLAGYVRTPSGRLRSFAVLLNRYTGSGGAVRKGLEPLLRSFAAE